MPNGSFAARMANETASTMSHAGEEAGRQSATVTPVTTAERSRSVGCCPRIFMPSPSHAAAVSTAMHTSHSAREP